MKGCSRFFSTLFLAIVGLIAPLAHAQGIPPSEGGPDSQDKPCCICFGQMVSGSPANDCANVDWGDRCEPANRYTCHLRYSEQLKRIVYTCIDGNGQLAPPVGSDGRHPGTLPTANCSSFTVVVDGPKDNPQTPVDETLDVTNLCFNGVYDFETGTDSWPSCAYLLGSCSASDPEQRSYLCDRIKDAQTLRKDNPGIPDITFIITENGVEISPECLTQADQGTIPGGVFKITVKTDGSVQVLKCTETTCVPGDLSLLCPGERPTPPVTPTTTPRPQPSPTSPSGPSTPPQGGSGGQGQQDQTVVTVTVYSKDGCGPCVSLKATLRNNNIPFGNIHNRGLPRGANAYPHTVIKRGNQTRSVSGNNIAAIQQAIRELSRR